MTTTLWHRSGDRQLKKVALAAAPGAKVQFYAGGTTTPLTTYTEAGASTPHNTVSLVTDGNGLWPNVFIPYGSFDYRILDSDDTIITTATNVPNPAPVDPTSTDQNSLMQTGDMIFSPAAVTRAGFVRANGNTIGSGASSATERANDDAETLFTWLWNNLADAQAAVSGGRGGTASADWNANKTIALPDFRGSSPLGLDDMGAGVALRFTGATFGHGNATTGGSRVGGSQVTLTEANLAAHAHSPGTLAIGNYEHSHGVGTFSISTAGAHTHSGNTGNDTPDHTHNSVYVQSIGTVQVAAGVGVAPAANAVQGTFTSGGANSRHTHPFSTSSNGNHNHIMTGSSANSTNTPTISGASASVGVADPISIINNAILGTWLIKL